MRCFINARSTSRIARFSAVVLILSALVLAVLPSSVRAASIVSIDPPSGEVGKQVQLIGSITCGQDFEIHWDNVKPESMVYRGKSSGCRYAVANFRIPETSKGRHRVILVDISSGDEATFDFIVVPTIYGSEKKGPVGTAIKLTGTGFAANETDIRVMYDKVPLQGSTISDGKGSFTLNSAIPESFKGNHYIQAAGILTPVEEVGYIPFEVTPGISVEPTTGGTGASVAVVGTGFDAEEKDIKVTFDGEAVQSGITASNTGSFKTTFVVPAAAKKDHSVDAFGAGTRATEVPNILFNLGTAISVDPLSGYVGDKFTIMGSGFVSGETDIKVFYSDAEVASGIKADDNGTWKAVLAIPPSVAGDHPVSAAGGVTYVKDVKSQIFKVLPKLALKPTGGEAGTPIEVSGSGFGMGQPLTMNYDDQRLTLTVTSDSKGTFSTTFKAPNTANQQHQVTAADNAGNKAAAAFYTETVPPPTPSLTLPTPDARLGSATSVGKQKVTFEWTAVTDASGVSYILDVSQTPDFNKPLLQQTGITKSSFALTDAEALDPGSYFWRVKAVDGAGNESAWTEARTLSISGVSLNLLFLIGAGLLVIVLGLIWGFTAFGRKAGGGPKK